MDWFAIALSITASLLMLAGYKIYNKDIARHGKEPNATSWGLWAVGGIVVIYFYEELTSDWVKGLPLAVCAIYSIWTFAQLVRKKSYSRPDLFDVEIAVLDIVVIVYWLTTNNKALANIFIEIDIWITFIPILRSTWLNPGSERSRVPAWSVWTLSYTLLVGAVLLRLENWWDVFLPANYVAQHGLVLLLSLNKIQPFVRRIYRVIGW